MEDGSAFGGRPVRTFWVSLVKDPNFTPVSLYFVQQHTSGVCDIEIDVLLVEHKQTEKKAFGSSQGY